VPARLLGRVMGLVGWTIMVELMGMPVLYATELAAELCLTVVETTTLELWLGVAALEDDGAGVLTGYPPPYWEDDGVGVTYASHSGPLEMPNWFEYWYWPVTSSMSWSP
jgi:hypothetical protein